MSNHNKFDAQKDIIAWGRVRQTIRQIQVHSYVLPMLSHVCLFSLFPLLTVKVVVTWDLALCFVSISSQAQGLVYSYVVWSSNDHANAKPTIASTAYHSDSKRDLAFTISSGCFGVLAHLYPLQRLWFLTWCLPLTTFLCSIAVKRSATATGVEHAETHQISALTIAVRSCVYGMKYPVKQCYLGFTAKLNRQYVTSTAWNPSQMIHHSSSP